MTYTAPSLLDSACRDALRAWVTHDRTARLWAGDASLWTGADEGVWLGWLDLADMNPESLTALRTTLAPVRVTTVTKVLLLGMGGSSLGAEVVARVLPPGEHALPIRIVDSLMPAAVVDAFDSCDWSRTIVVVASKSGGTLEPAVLLAMARARLDAALGMAAPARIIAITDPGSALGREAVEFGYGAVVHGHPSIGGRFSVLSPFGLVPALLHDAPIAPMRERALAMADRCRQDGDDNPGVALGLALATAARAGRDKCTVLLPASLAPMGAWIEQLVAESTGKDGTMILPIVDEPIGPAVEYGPDRIVVHVSVTGESDPHMELAGALAAAGHPVFRIESDGAIGLWAEFFRWEFATAVAGAALGVHPFDQPDVEASKIATRELSASWERDGVPMLTEVLSTDAPTAELDGALRSWLADRAPGDYVALLAWLAMNDATVASLGRLRAAIRRATRLATSVGFGPRYLHSTGQAFKGGPNSGLFLSLTTDDRIAAVAPGRALPLAAIARAQREGELAVLRARGRRVLEIELGHDLEHAVTVLADAITRVS